MISDAHFHLKQLLEVSPEQADFIKENNFYGMCSCRTLEEVEFVENFIAKNPETVQKLKISFGIHPQAPDEKELKTLEKLVFENRIAAVGEIGLDRFNEEFAKTFDLQKKLFVIQLEIAKKAGLPVILHIRKAIQEVFEQIQTLKELKKVIFHSFSGTAEEAGSILNHGVNACFSFGNALLNGHKKAIETVRSLPAERILIETDAPYQPKKGDPFSKLLDLVEIMDKINEIRGCDSSAFVSSLEPLSLTAAPLLQGSQDMKAGLGGSTEKQSEGSMENQHDEGKQ